MYSRLDSPIFKARVMISLCGALFLGCLGLYELVKAGSSLLQLNQFRQNSLPVEALSFTSNDNGYLYTISFQYEANGVRYSKSEDVSKAFYEPHRYGNGNLTVYVHRTQHSIAYLDVDHLYSLRKDEVLFGGGATIFCVLIFSFWYWMYFGRER